MDTRKDLCRIGRDMKDCGLVAACDGNISYRRDDATVVITPSGVPKERLKPSKLLVVDMDGKVVKGKGKASSETMMHLLIYKLRPDVKAIVHAHPTVATALTVSGVPFPTDIVTEGELVLKRVPTIPYAAPGTQDLAVGCAKAMRAANVALLERHGAVTVGKDLDEALFRMETLEKVAIKKKQELDEVESMFKKFDFR